MMRTAWSRKAGFTLIEIMVVVGIMGLILAMGIPSIYQLAKKEGMRRAATDMKDVLTNARAQAIISGSEVQVKFYPLDGRFEVSGGGGGGARTPSINSQPIDDTTPAPSKTTAATLPAGITFGALKVNLLNYRESEWTRVRFFPNGTSDELRLVLESETGEIRGIELEPTTGLTRMVSNMQEIRTWE